MERCDDNVCQVMGSPEDTRGQSGTQSKACHQSELVSNGRGIQGHVAEAVCSEADTGRGATRTMARVMERCETFHVSILSIWWDFGHMMKCDVEKRGMGEEADTISARSFT